jgi:hypothetical protein
MLRRYARLKIVNEVPEGRDATGKRRIHGVPPRNLLAGRPGSVCVHSSSVAISLSLPATADESPAAKAETDRTGAERRERSDRRGDRAAGPSGPDRGGGWERRVRVDGAAAGGMADGRRREAERSRSWYYILHLRESNPRSVVFHRERRLAGDSHE